MTDQKFKEHFVMHFGSKESEISSRTLGEALISFSTAIEEINNTLHTGKDVSIKVKPFEEGSFEVPFELIEMVISGVLSAPSISSIPDIIKILKEFVDIKIKLKGAPPKNIEEAGNEIKLTSKTGDIYNISRVTGNLIINNVEINESFNKGIGRLTQDDSINEYSILDSNRKPILEVKEKDFSYFSLPAPTTCEESVQTKDNKKSVPATLRIHKVVFDTTSKWGFIYNGNKISARISDEEFQGKVQTDGRFGKGDILDVLMEIHQEFDEAVGVFINKAYVISKVFRHIPRPQQTSLC